MGLITCPSNVSSGGSGPDEESMVFSSGTLVTELGASDIHVINAPITLLGWALSANVAPTGAETVNVTIVEAGGGGGVLETLILPAGQRIASGTLLASYPVAAGDGVQANITQVNGSEQLSLSLFYRRD